MILHHLLLASGCGDKCKLPSEHDLGIPTISFTNGIHDIVQTVAFIAGVLSLVFIIIGGIRYASSSGNPQQIEGAKNTLMFAVIGLVVSLLASTIVAFVIGKTP